MLSIIDKTKHDTAQQVDGYLSLGTRCYRSRGYCQRILYIRIESMRVHVIVELINFKALVPAAACIACYRVYV